jgi:hypothetical protein
MKTFTHYIANMGLAAAACAVLVAVGVVWQQTRVAQASIVPTTVSNTGLVGYWSFDSSTLNWATGKVKDLSPYNNSGQLISMSTTTSPTLGVLGQALQFDGATQYVSLGTPAALSLPAALTISAWIKITRTSGGTADIVGQYDGLNLQYTFEVNRTAGKLSALANHSTVAVTGNTTLKINTWYHAALVRSGSTGSWTYTLYLNGVQDGTATVGGSTEPQTSASIGTLGAFNTFYFPGSIDEVRMYNRALSQQEVTNLYNQKATTLGKANTTTLSTGLVGYWPLDGATTNWATGSTTDASGNGNFGSLMSLSTSTSPVGGVIGQALNFKGGTQRVVTPSSSSFAYAGGDYTFSVWFKVVANSGTTEYILDHGGNGGSIIFEGPGNTLGFYNASSGVGSALYTTGFGTITLGKWYHAVAVRRSLVTSLYLNGVFTVSATDIRSYPASAITIGSYGGGSGNSFYGSIDDVRIYNRALTQNEVSQLYKLGTANIAHSSTTLVPNGLVGYWPMDGNSTDMSGNGNSGSLIGMSTSTSPVAGKSGQALNFGTVAGTYIKLASPTSMNFASNFTLSAWIKPGQLRNYNIIAVRGPGGGTGSDFEWYLTTTSMIFNTNHTNGGTFSQSFVSVPAAGTWSHVAVVVTNNSLRFYINGVQQGAAQAMSNPLATLSEWDIGYMPVNNGFTSTDLLRTFGGGIDDFRVYNRALSAQEVAQLYVASK